MCKRLYSELQVRFLSYIFNFIYVHINVSSFAEQLLLYWNCFKLDVYILTEKSFKEFVLEQLVISFFITLKFWTNKLKEKVSWENHGILHDHSLNPGLKHIKSLNFGWLRLKSKTEIIFTINFVVETSIYLLNGTTNNF